MAECPVCGYVLGPMERTCPRCARVGGAARPDARPGARRARRASAPWKSWAAIGIPTVVALAILAAVGLHYGRSPVPEADTATGGVGSAGTGSSPQTGEATTSERTEGGGVASPEAGGSAVAGETPPEAEPDPAAAALRALVQQCPFDIQVGARLKARPGAPDEHILTVFAEGGISYAQCGTWELGGSGGQVLRMGLQERAPGVRAPTLWVDQPFEIWKDGRLVATFESTDEYRQAQQ